MSYAKGVDLYNVPYLPLLMRATIASARVIRDAWWQPIGGVEAKRDGTLVTNTDKASQAAADKYLKKTGLDLWYEEGPRSQLVGTRFQVMLDPLDGTTAFNCETSTSTVSAALYDTLRRQVVACMVAEPARARLWVSVTGMGTWRCRIPNGMLNVKSILAQAEPCTVWDGALSRKSMVYTDCTSNFSKEGYPTVPDEVWAGFLSKLFRISRFQMMGTNCGHHAFVANGGRGVAAAITTAVGGPYDVTPVHLVLEAGGAARAFSTSGKGLTEVDPLRVDAYNYLVSGNSSTTVDVLSEMLIGHLRESEVVTS